MEFYFDTGTYPDFLASSETLSVGKRISWSGPAAAIGGSLFLIAQFSLEVSFLQERFPVSANNKISAASFIMDSIQEILGLNVKLLFSAPQTDLQ